MTNCSNITISYKIKVFDHSKTKELIEYRFKENLIKYLLYFFTLHDPLYDKEKSIAHPSNPFIAKVQNFKNRIFLF